MADIANLLEQTGFRQFPSPKTIDLVYVEILKDPFPTPQEAEVVFQFSGKSQPAFVPLRLVNEQQMTAKAALIGESEGKILVSFPPTNFGQTRFLASPQELAEIVFDSAGDGSGP